MARSASEEVGGSGEECGGGLSQGLLDQVNTLGKKLNVYATTIFTPHFTVSLWRMLAHDIAREIGMSPVDQPKVWEYPVGGKGGKGLTIIQPITESFIAIDTWPDLNGAYLVICSCRDFDVAKLNRFLRVRLGLRLGDSADKLLELSR